MLYLPSSASIEKAVDMNIHATDFDNDGYLDILSQRTGSRTELLLNNGRGSFDENEILHLPFDIQSIFPLHANNDDFLDIVFSDVFKNVYLLLNEGSGRGFSQPLLVSQGRAVSAVADINNDGSIDIIVSLSSSDFTNVCLNSNAIQDMFPSNNCFPIPNSDGSLVSVSDLNSDGMLDFVIIKEGRGQKPEIMISRPQARFQSDPHHLIRLKDDVSTVYVQKIDHDDRLDVLVDRKITKFGTGYTIIELYINESDGKFSNPHELATVNGFTSSLVAADINEDGIMDLIIGSDRTTNEIFDSSFNINSTIPLPLTSFRTTDIGVADINNDGLLDIVVGNAGARNQILFNKGPENGFFTDAINLPGEAAITTASIAIADVNNDGILDIIVGNGDDEQNELLLSRQENNNQDQNGLSWVSHPLPGAISKSVVITVADMDNDGFIDIVVGNDGAQNQILINQGGNGTSYVAIDLPSAGIEASSTLSMTVADINGDGLVDIVVGGASRLDTFFVVNNGIENGFDLEVVDVPGFSFEISAMAVGDLNGDGYLDLVLANNGEGVIYIPYEACPDGGARLHGKSWCFSCPSFMGRVVLPETGKEEPICRECPPHYSQQDGVGAQCDLYKPCLLGQRLLGEDSCSERCPDGTYYNKSVTRTENDIQTWDAMRCDGCSVGTYSRNQDQPAVNFCFDCLPGTYQNNTASDSCIKCPVGTYNEFFSARDDNSCRECDFGTYNDLEGE